MSEPVPYGPGSEALMDKIESLSPPSCVTQPEEIVDADAFLCSPAASYINGAALVTDNALSLTINLGGLIDREFYLTLNKGYANTSR